MTFKNTDGVEGSKARPFNINNATNDMSGPNIKKDISSAGLLATLFSPLYPRSSGHNGNDSSFPTTNNVLH